MQDRVLQEVEALGASCHRSRPEIYVREALKALRVPSRPGRGGPTEIPALDAATLAGLIDHTQLSPTATEAQVRRLCEEALEYEFAAVCVHPCYVPFAKRTLGAVSTPAICTVIGFPLGANRTTTKVRETRQAIQDGAREVDMVLGIGLLKSKRFEDVEADIRAVVDAAREEAPGAGANVTVKVILETALLTNAEKCVACVAARRAGADYVKTSTGFAHSGATTYDVALLRQVVGDTMGVKASGGIRSFEDVQQMVAHGATRIGASGSVAIMKSFLATNH